MKRLRVFATAAALAALSALGLPAAAQEPGGEVVATTGFDGVPEDFGCAAQSWVAGTVELCGGVLTYRDYVYDDYGADRGMQGTSTGTLAYPAGDDRYPEGAQPNTADLVDLSLRVEGNRLEVLGELNALYEAESTVLAVAIDTDDDVATGGGAWGDLGVESAGWDVLALFTEGDPLSNLIGGSLPLPDGDRWRLQAATAVAGGPVLNVAFRGPDEQAVWYFSGLSATNTGAWFEDLQAQTLALGNVSAFGQTVDVADLRGGASGSLTAVGPGLHERVYTSSVTLPPGEGMSYTGIRGRGTGGPSAAFGQQFHYFGRYQPYGIYLPDQAAPHGMHVLYHGSNQNLAAHVNRPGMQQRLGEEQNRILVAPLARGVHGYGSDISERDLLDVEADVLAHYDVDRDRVYTGGTSQGGYVTFRQSALHPDRYAGFTSWVGFTGDATNPADGDLVTAGAVGNMIDFVGNYRHVAGAMLFGAVDELVHISSAEAIGNEFRQQDFPYAFYMHGAADHFVLYLADDPAKEAAYSAQFTRVEDPLRVTFRTASVLGEPHYGILHDEAYWVSQVRGRTAVSDHFAAEESYIDVDLLAPGCGGEVPEVALTPGAGPDPVPWVSDSNVVTGMAEVAPEPALRGTLANVASLVVDTEATCLAGQSVEYELTTDGPSVIRFTDGRTLELTDAGTHTGAFSPIASAPGTSGGLPATIAVERAGGADRVATAIAVSQAAYEQAPAVVIATAGQYADALAGAPLAAGEGGPLLLTPGDALDPRVLAEVERLGATRAVLLGGEAALGPAVASALTAAGLDVERIAGADRFATAAAIALRVAEGRCLSSDGDTACPDNLPAGDAQAADVLLVLGGDADPARGWPDAVAASALAAQLGIPLLLTSAEALPDATRQALVDLATTRVTVVGGEAAVPQRTVAMTADPDGDGTGQVAWHRIAGADRFATAAAVADRALAFGTTSDTVWVATGRNWPDALAAGPAAAATGAVLLLADGTASSGASGDWIEAHLPVATVHLVGGTAVIDE